MPFEWDEAKNRANRKKHEPGFETAALVFDDPYALTQRDFSQDEEELHHSGVNRPRVSTLRGTCEL